MTVEALNPDERLGDWPGPLLAEEVELPEPVWTRAPERVPSKPAKKTTRKQRKRR